MFGKIKEILKMFIPLPVRTFNRRMNEFAARIEALEHYTKQNNFASEAVWAHVFNNTISGSTWLLDKSFSPGRWAVGYPYLYVMYRVLNELHPRRILELGLGQSTRMIAQYASSFCEVEHVVVEHDKQWIDFFSGNFELPANTETCHLDIQRTEFKMTSLYSYVGFKDYFHGRTYDFISIDAPFGDPEGNNSANYARVDIIPLLPDILGTDFVIMIDDVQRNGERNTIAEIKKTLNDSGIVCHVGIYEGAKQCAVICADHLRFLTTM